MSHRFKQVPHAKPSEAFNERQIRLMAEQLRDQADVEKLLEGASDEMRAAMLERIAPFIDFEIFDTTPTPDCPNCGMKRGTIIPHHCQAN